MEKSTFSKLFSSVETHKPLLLPPSFAFDDGFLFFAVSKPKKKFGGGCRARRAHSPTVRVVNDQTEATFLGAFAQKLSQQIRPLFVCHFRVVSDGPSSVFLRLSTPPGHVDVGFRQWRIKIQNIFCRCRLTGDGNQHADILRGREDV